MALSKCIWRVLLSRHVNNDKFKIRRRHLSYARFLSESSKRREPDPLRELSSVVAKAPPTTISLAPGFPNTTLFPFKEAEIQLRDGTTLSIPEDLMSKALQYLGSEGYRPFLDQMKEMIGELHQPPTAHSDDPDTVLDHYISAGGTDALHNIMDNLINVGDYVLMESPTWPSVITALRGRGVRMLSVDSDRDGLKPEALRQQMSRWSKDDVNNPSSDIPKVLYIIPVAGNPSGVSLPIERKREIYQICQEYNLLILEDDPYYFLQFTEERVPTFLSIDTDGRVVRIDSFSKLLAAGLRVAAVSGPRLIINKMVEYTMVSSNHCNGLSQVMYSELLGRWGIQGFLEHTKKVSAFYEGQRDAMMASAERWLTGLADWHYPTGGMFLWMKLRGIKDTKRLIQEKAAKKEVLLVPGFAFVDDQLAPSPYLRACFSFATPEQFDKAFERLSALIKEELEEQDNR